MKQFINRSCLLVFFFVLLSFSGTQALTIWGADASGELIGSRTNSGGGGVDAAGPWDDGIFTISWDISEDSSGIWTYVYSIGIPSNKVSHFILEVTEDEEPFTTYEGTSGPAEKIYGPGTFSSASEYPSTNPSMPNAIYGLWFDFGGGAPEYTIVTDRAPVYGVFYTSDGTYVDADGNVKDVVAWSNALNSSDYKTSESLTATDFIVRPDGYAAPIPGSVWLLGSGLLGLVGMSRKRT